MSTVKQYVIVCLSHIYLVYSFCQQEEISEGEICPQVLHLRCALLPNALDKNMQP